MISHSFSPSTINTFGSYQELAGEIATTLTQNDWESPYASVLLAVDTQGATASQTLAKKYSKAKIVVVIGIGGSSLGIRAIAEALNLTRGPELHLLETIDDHNFSTVCTRVAFLVRQPSDLLVVIISKSGSTTETVVNASLFDKFVEKHVRLHTKDCSVVITDAGSKLETIAKDLGIPSLQIPRQVGGRFSVFSAVGVFTLAVAGIQTEKLLSGAKKAINLFTTEREKSYAFQQACLLFSAYNQGIYHNDLFLFSSRLESLGKWYRQLVAESLGKDGKGIFPTVSIGTQDLHSMVQYYLGGQRSLVTHFVLPNENQNLLVEEGIWDKLVPAIVGKTSTTVVKAIRDGVLAAYTKKGISYCVTEVDTVNEEFLGEWMQTEMLVIMLVGKLLQINTFDQPNVEDYKQETRMLLGK